MKTEKLHAWACPYYTCRAFIHQAQYPKQITVTRDFLAQACLKTLRISRGELLRRIPAGARSHGGPVKKKAMGSSGVGRA